MSPDKLVEIFNSLFPVGSTVRWRSIGKDSVPFQNYTVRGKAINNHGSAVCWFHERSGMCSIEPQFVDYTMEKSNAA